MILNISYRLDYHEIATEGKFQFCCVKIGITWSVLPDSIFKNPYGRASLNNS